MKTMEAHQLLEHLHKTGMKYAVGVAEMAGVPRALLVLDDGTMIAMDEPMLATVLPMLQNALKILQAGQVPPGGVKQ